MQRVPESPRQVTRRARAQSPFSSAHLETRPILQLIDFLNTALAAYLASHTHGTEQPTHGSPGPTQQQAEFGHLMQPQLSLSVQQQQPTEENILAPANANMSAVAFIR